MKGDIFFDLDGTLLDSRRRVHELFLHLSGGLQIDFDAYWNRKKEGVSNVQLLEEHGKLGEIDPAEFQTTWMSLIESPEWLNLDKPFMGVTDCLRRLSWVYRLHIITARQSAQRALGQVRSFGWEGLFVNVLVTEHERTKIEMLSGMNMENTRFMVGDTGLDITTGKHYGMTTVAVLSGFRSRNYLEKYSPDHIVEYATAIEDILEAP